ncbi:MAG TPA: DUF2784 domain-containing protein [Gammaproteobacteria bacterium]
MIYSLLADLVVVIHLLFILFVVFGGLVGLWRAWALLLHIPAVIWGAVIEFANLVCPLTPLENRLRHAGGEPGYNGGFIEHYLIPILYPSGLTPTLQLVLGMIVIAINIAMYGFVIYRRRRRKRVAE